MELGSAEIARIEQMAGQGMTIAQISKEMGIDYWLVWNHARSWQGTKWVVTNRLKRLAKESNQAIREQMVEEIAECVNYFYYQGKHLGSQIKRARKALDAGILAATPLAMFPHLRDEE